MEGSQRASPLLSTLLQACSELRNSSHFGVVLKTVLKIGNHLNTGSFRGNAQGFKLETLLKLADVKGTDRKTSLLAFVLKARTDPNRPNAKTETDRLAQELQKTAPATIFLSAELGFMKPASALHTDHIRGVLEELERGVADLKRCGAPPLTADGLDGRRPVV